MCTDHMRCNAGDGLQRAAAAHTHTHTHTHTAQECLQSGCVLNADFTSVYIQ